MLFGFARRLEHKWVAVNAHNAMEWIARWVLVVIAISTSLALEMSWISRSRRSLLWRFLVLVIRMMPILLVRRWRRWRP